MANKTKNKIIIGSILSSGIFFTSQAFAGCYFVACPNVAPPVQKAAPQYYAPTQDLESNSDNYDKGFQDGLNAAKPKIIYVKSKNSAKKKTNKTFAKKASISKTAVKSISKSNKSKIVYSSKSSIAASPKAKIYNSNVKSYGYKPTQTQNYLPIKDRASTYQAGQYGQSIAVASLMGRGEQWVSSKTQIVRYNRPHQIQIVNGKSCGWSSPLSHNNYGANNAWVCQCEQGWLPSR